MNKGYQTLCGFYILGNSGVEHEIDNVGESTNDNRRIFWECKNALPTVNDVFLFSGKMLDTGSRGYIFTTNRSVDEKLKLFAI